MRSDAFETNNWRWLRAYWFEECKDALILDGIWPAVQHVCASERASAAYFQRHWFGGPHVLLGIHAAASNDAASEIAEAIRVYLAAHPSSTQRSVSEIHRQMEALRAQEHLVRAREHPGETVPISLQPNNSVQLEATEPYSPYLTDIALKSSVREFLSRSSGFAVHWLELIREGRLDRHEICLQIMIALAWLADPDRLRSHLSFSSHARALLAVRDRRSGSLRRIFAEKYEGPAGQRVRLLLQDSTEKLSSGRDPASRMCEFVDLLRDMMAEFFTGLRSGRYQPAPAAVTVGKARRGPIDYSRLMELLDEQPALRAWQIMVSLLYQVLNQMGLQAADRFLACYLLSRAAEDLFGQSTEVILHNLNATGDPREMVSFFSHFETANSQT